MYYHGVGVDKDYSQAFLLLKTLGNVSSKSAQGLVDYFFQIKTPLLEDYITQAAYFLAVMFENGQGIDQNIQEAMNWYKIAAERGNADAQKKISNGFSSPNIKKEAVTNADEEIDNGSTFIFKNVKFKFVNKIKNSRFPNGACRYMISFNLENQIVVPKDNFFFFTIKYTGNDCPYDYVRDLKTYTQTKAENFRDAKIPLEDKNLKSLHLFHVELDPNNTLIKLDWFFSGLQTLCPGQYTLKFYDTNLNVINETNFSIK